MLALMDVLQIVLRLVHIVAGVFWVGSVAFLFDYLVPTTRALGPQAAPVMAHLNQKLRLSIITPIAGLVTVLAGLILYWRTSGGLDDEWLQSGPGIGFTVGGITGILALAVGATVTRKTVKRIGELGGAIVAGGGPPSPEQGAEMQALQQRLRALGRVLLFLLGISVAAMAVARYL